MKIVAILETAKYWDKVNGNTYSVSRLVSTRTGKTIDFDSFGYGNGSNFYHYSHAKFEKRSKSEKWAYSNRIHQVDLGYLKKSECKELERIWLNEYEHDNKRKNGKGL